MTTKLTLEERKQRLREWSDAYYNQGSSPVSDEDFDKEQEEVIQLVREQDPNDPFLEEIGAPIVDGVWPKHKHASLMGSLAKARAEKIKEDFEAWLKRDGANKLNSEGKLHLSEKCDGCTVVATYKQGKLVVLATRGDGVTGDDITPNAKYFQNVPLKLAKPLDLTLRGEAIIRVSNFKKFSGFANPRNAAAGKVRDTNDDPLKRQVEVLWFEVVNSENSLATWSDQFKLLNSLGLTTPNWAEVTVEQLWQTYKEYVESKRANLDYWIDGLVVRTLDLTTYGKLGISSNRPKGAIALKFPAQGKEATILGIEINRGLQGRFTPVALISPVEIDGTKVQRATMNNFDWIAEMDLAIGDVVEIIKGGDIIPKIVRKIKDGSRLNRKIIQTPTRCDVCDHPLVKSGKYLECVNSDCSGQVYGTMLKWLERNDIKGIGPAKLRELIASGIDDIAKLYSADEQSIRKAVSSDTIGQKIYQAIQNARQVELATFIAGLNISAVGVGTSQDLAAYFKTLDNLLAAKPADLQDVPGISGNSVKIYVGIQDKLQLINQLTKLIVIKEAGCGNATGKLSGKSFCITGTLPSGKKRSEVENWIKSQGGTVKSSVTKDLSYLVVGGDDGPNSSKSKKADSLKITKISEEQLYQL